MPEINSMKTIHPSRKDFRKVYVQLALAGALLLGPVHALMAQAASKAEAGGTNGWVIVIAVLALLVLSWTSWRFAAKRRAVREARLATERRAQEEARLAAIRREEEAHRAEKRRTERENWTKELPDRLESAIKGGARTPHARLEVVFQQHPDSEDIVALMEGEVAIRPPILLDEVISDLREVVEAASRQDKKRAVWALEAVIKSLHGKKAWLDLRKDVARKDAWPSVRSGAPSGSASSPVGSPPRPPRFPF
jgi:hypothetical protein